MNYLGGLAAGYTVEQVLNYLSKTFPALGPRIKQAVNAGKSPEEILKYLGKFDKTALSKLRTNEQPFEPFPESQESNRLLQADQAVKDYDPIPEIVKQGAKAAIPLGVGAAIAPKLGAMASQYAPEAIGVLDRALPTNLKGMIPALTGAPQGSPQQSSQTSQPPQVNQVTQPIVPQQPETTQPEQIPTTQELPAPIPKQEFTPIEKESTALWERLSKGVKSHPNKEISAFLKVADLLKKTRGEMSKEAFDGLYKDFVDRRQAGEPFSEIANDMVKGYKASKEDESKLSTGVPTEKSDSVPIAKKDIVSSPEGVGTVREIRNGQAVIDVDGKLHKVKESELEPEPEEVKESKISFDIDKIPEDLRSAPLNEVYVPADRRHVTVKFNSNVGGEKDKRYLYFRKDGQPVDSEIVEKLRVGSQIPVTSGENFWGAWNAKTQDSRGTVAFHELTRMAQREGEEDDPSKPFWFVEEEEVFKHGYVKEYEKHLKAKEREFNEKRKKRKKKAT